ncbi:gamma carbonic anhydrase family protein [Eubacterium barkeri]|uniref:Carbonic anhydrase or acetyltransferase, isoleucine patch superfamily n=1 Tax=Eubacterium barkeri TaxID=1528 RepID=A0A1H3I4C8_EUBBA|nr:gamma carbonic anhydrase family protein [Eubacterium barkeri]SDY22530.1 Carbonic anhydrase or acetyltransferase, isoleucine patch superfamily [Eubacterium barkeri]
MKSEKTPRIHETAYIAPGAVVEGDVTLEENVSILHNAVLHGDVTKITIGPRCNIQECSVVHGDWDSVTVLGRDVSVGHGAILHSCIIEDECMVGMGAIVMDYAHIGTGSIVAAGALVPAHMAVPPHSLVVGSPAKVRREVTSEEYQRIILDSAEHYVNESKKIKEKNY